MLLSETRWLRTNVKKIDVQLRKEILNNFRHSKKTPCFLHSLINSFRHRFKKIKVIVQYAEAEIPQGKSLKKLIGAKAAKKGTLKSVNATSARLSPKKIQKLVEAGSIQGVWLDRKYKALLDVASPALGAEKAWSGNLTGKGITTAVIDTGISPHDDLVKPDNRIIFFKDFVKNRKNPYDDNGHGTHVAGDIAGNGYSLNSKYRAPAYESTLVGVKVLDKSGTGNLSTIIKAVDWCVDNKDKYKIKIINMSLGSEVVDSYKKDLLCTAVESAWDAGIVVCVAAGNEGPGEGTISSPGNDPKIITVGAADDRNTPESNGDGIATFSSRGPTPIDGLPKPDIICPGVDIISLRARCSYISRETPAVDTNYCSLSGTSMATPLCCSCVALLLENNPSLTPNEIKQKLMENTTDLDYNEQSQGAGLVNLNKLLADVKSKKHKDEKPLK